MVTYEILWPDFSMGLFFLILPILSKGDAVLLSSRKNKGRRCAQQKNSFAILRMKD